MIIAWLIDDPEWAFGLGFKRISALLPEYEHKVYTADQLSETPSLFDEIKAADAVLCPWPVWLSRFETLDNVVAGIKSRRTFDGVNNVN